MRTSVRSDAGSPSSGAVWRKPVAGFATRHAASPSTSPSRMGASSTALAATCLIESAAPSPRPAARGGVDDWPSSAGSAVAGPNDVWSASDAAEDSWDWPAAGKTGIVASTARTRPQVRRREAQTRCLLIGCSRAAAGVAAPPGSDPRPQCREAPRSPGVASPTSLRDLGGRRQARWPFAAPRGPWARPRWVAPVGLGVSLAT